jgi:hypothetical protein
MIHCSAGIDDLHVVLIFDLDIRREPPDTAECGCPR